MAVIDADQIQRVAAQSDGRALLTQDLNAGRDALLFEVRATAGGSGSTHLLALLEPGKGKYLSNLTPELTFGDQSEYRFWSVPSVSDMPLLVLADASWGAGETHFSKHRFFITIYGFDLSLHFFAAHLTDVIQIDVH